MCEDSIRWEFIAFLAFVAVTMISGLYVFYKLSK